jgi:hypothetical protein
MKHSTKIAEDLIKVQSLLDKIHSDILDNYGSTADGKKMRRYIVTAYNNMHKVRIIQFALEQKIKK